MRLLIVVFSLLTIDWVDCAGSTYYFNDDIVPCDDMLSHYQASHHPDLDQRIDESADGEQSNNVNSYKKNFVNVETDEGLSYSNKGYAKVTNKNTAKQHDRFSGAVGTNAYKRYFKKDMTQSSRGNANTGPKLSLIVDTDIGQFPDDPVALAVVHGAADLGNADLLAIIGSTQYEGIAMGIDVINHFFDRSHIPIGVTKDSKAYADPPGTQRWTEFVRDRFKNKLDFNADAEDALSVYRRALANSPDGSVTILAIGHFINLANLLETPPDKMSKLNGRNLIKRKVKEVIAMAGAFPRGREWNIEKDVMSARIFAANWPSKVTYVGFEIGNVTCGTKYQGKTLEASNPIAATTYFGHQQFGTYEGCFDAVAALIAARETSKFYCAVYGQIRISQDGSNDWVYSSRNRAYHQRYLKVRGDPLRIGTTVTKRIDDFLPDIE